MLKTLFLIFAVSFIALYLGGEVLGMLFGVIGTVFGAGVARTFVRVSTKSITM